MKLALCVFARAPRAGRVKTRLIGTLGADGAAALYARLLTRMLAVAADAPVATREIHVDTAASLPWFSALPDFDCRVQVEGDLGTRMHVACATLLEDHEAVLLMGSDLLDVTAADLALAATWLRGDTEVVLGPVADGGYWLIGLRQPQPTLFDDMPWSTRGVYAATVARLAAQGSAWRALPLRHDVDDEHDLTPACGV